MKTFDKRPCIRTATQLVLFVFFIHGTLFSQDLRNSLRTARIPVLSDVLRIDTLSLVPGSVQLFDEHGKALPQEFYRVDYVSASIFFKTDSAFQRPQFIRLKYRVLPVNLGQTFQNRDTLQIIKQNTSKGYVWKETAENEKFTDDEEKLNRNGSISRGISVGNQRDLSTLSNFNLQLAGKLNDQISIEAAISDNNMPVQPEGNTQQIQDFDKVSIHLFTKTSGIEMGDVSLLKPEGYFLNLSKQTRGMRLYSSFGGKEEKAPRLQSGLTAGLAKGKYKRLKLNGIEGNQGPYKLSGDNNELYIIILSGSEKIYIDGKLLTRGEKFDYVMDYNSAEITFTTNQPITKDSRITAEYEYSQQFFPRLQILQYNQLQTKKMKLWFNFFLEKDNKNDPLSEIYSVDNQRIIASVGDSISHAFAPNINQVEFSADRILYQLKDSLVDGFYYDTVFVYSVNPALAAYQLGFSYVGENQGNYRPVVNNANGKVYEWIAPVNGIKQGNYEPLSFFATPKSSMLSTIGGQFKINPNGLADFEMALSNYDVNTYSTADKENDMGYALKFGFDQLLFHKDSNRLLRIYATYQMANQYFRPIENFQQVEFERDWNLAERAESWQEQSGTLGIAFDKKELGFIHVNASLMQRAYDYLGRNVQLNSNIRFNGFRFETNFSLLGSADITSRTTYLKHKVTLMKEHKRFVFGISEEFEGNSRSLRNSDSLLPNSFRFAEYSVFLRQADSSVNQYFVNYKWRKDFQPKQNRLSESGSAQTAQAGVQFSKNKNLSWKTVLTYRNLNYGDTSTHFSPGDNYLSGRQELNFKMAKSAIVLSTFYETGSGLELKRQYQFIEVQAGQGQYQWIDYNGNGLKELDEFELAKFPDQAKYIQIFIPSDQYFRVYTTQLNQSISIQPERIWLGKQGFRGFLASFSEQFAGQVVQKAEHADFIPDIEDNNALITRFLIVRNNFSYRSKNRKLQLEYLIDFNKGKSLLINGLDKRINENHSFRGKYKRNDKLLIFNTYYVGSQEYESEFFSWKNFRIEKNSNEVKLEYQLSQSITSGIKYKFSKKLNKNGLEQANMNELNLNLNQELSAKVNLQADFSYILIDFQGETGSPVAYEMLDGLANGKNMLWTVSYNQRLTKVLHLNIGYFGRLTGDLPSIHNGTVQIRADF